jgi:hypothetical protein
MDVLLFTLDHRYGAAALAAGVAAVVVDWEWSGKAERQDGRDTEINSGTPEHLARQRAAHTGSIVCRINNTPEARVSEARSAVALGAGEVWLPMVRSVDEVTEVLRAVGDAAEVGVVAETREALAMGRALSLLPLSRVYIGLHDLRIDRGSTSLFEPLVDGTTERFRNVYRGPLGFAGITRPERGVPVPQRLLLAEMVRLGAAFGVARRAFRADVPAEEIGAALAAIDTAVAELSRRNDAQIALDRRELVDTVTGLKGSSACG